MFKDETAFYLKEPLLPSSYPTGYEEEGSWGKIKLMNRFELTQPSLAGWGVYEMWQRWKPDGVYIGWTFGKEDAIESLKRIGM